MLKACRIFIAGCPLLLLAGCGQPNAYQPPPPPEVTVAIPVQMAVTNYLEETGTTEAVEKVEIKARVKGFLEEVQFEPGAMVKEGDALYRIEPELYQAKVNAAEAQLEALQAARDKARIERDRQLKLQKEDPGSTSEVAVVAAKAEFDAAEAGVKAAQAALDQARIDLNYTQVKTPISGRVGKTLVKIGNLVGDNEATHLTTVIDYDPIYANFNISERALLELRGKSTRPEEEQAQRKDVKVYLRRATDVGFPFEGQFDYADLAVDQSMGTFMIRGVFPNPDFQILPGLFVRIRIPIGQTPDALLVPERAVGTDQTGKYLLVVGSQNKVERRIVTVGSKFGDLVVINDGLQAGEKVIIDGLQRARPGTTVSSTQIELTPPEGDAEAVEKEENGPAREENPAEAASEPLPPPSQSHAAEDDTSS